MHAFIREKRRLRRTQLPNRFWIAYWIYELPDFDLKSKPRYPDEMPQAFFVVGRAHWGKSETLKALTGGRQRKTQIRNLTFIVKRRSNDDIDEEWHSILQSLDPSDSPEIIVAMCPEMDTLTVLRNLRTRGYRLFFWIISRRSDGRQGVPITQAEVAPFGQLGVLEFCHQPADQENRARQLQRFIESHP